jgi:hypothetical protein
MKFVADLDGTGVSKGKNFVDGVNSQDVATIHNLHALVRKAPVRARVTTNVVVASPGATLDTLSAVLNERFFLDGQTLGQEKGVYVWNGAAAPMTRSLDCDESSELDGAFIRVVSGTSAGQEFRQTVAAPVVGVTPLVFTQWGGGVVAFNADLGDATLSTFVVTHNFGSRNLDVHFYENATPFGRVYPELSFNTANQITVQFSVIPTLNQYHVTVKPL